MSHEEQLAELGFIREDDGSLRIDDLVIRPPPLPAMSTEAPPTRLIITKLLVRNFKSYAGEQEIGPFNKNFTAVVGPNGSGKSNVIDSLMFVFGSRSKDIRAKKMTALIHSSSECPNCTSCTVTVNFAMVSDKDGKVVEDSRFSVSRTVNIDGTSYYEHMKKRVQYKEIAKILRAYGIDLEYNRFLILQGEIESIALMPPKATPKESSGMLEYIEDIVGSQRLIEPIKYFEAKAAEVKEQEQLKAKDVDSHEKAKKELEGPRNEAISYLRLKNRSILCQNSLWQIKKLKYGKDLEVIEKDKIGLTDKLKSLKEEMKTVVDSKKALESSMAELSAQHAAIQKQVTAYDEEFNELVREDAANLLDIKHVKGLIQSNKKVLEESEKEISKLTKQCTTYESETLELQKKKEKFIEEKGVEEVKATEVIGTLQQETNAMQEQKDALEEKLVGLKDNCNQIKSEMDLIKSELKIYMSEDKKEKEKLASFQSDLKKNTDLVQKEESLIQEETQQLKEIESQLTTFKDELAQAKEKEISLTKQQSEARQKWEEARSSRANTQNLSGIMKGLMRGKAEGKLPAQGICGRLGDLGSIAEKYDVAISTNCGGLDNIVTDTVATAKACATYLKQNELGYTNFIPLENMDYQWPRLKEKKQFPKNTERLFDLIKVKDNKYLTAFYFVLQDTLVTQTLDQAKEAAYSGRRWRVCTLGGDVVETSGAMSGGGKSVYRGRIGQKIVEEQCQYSEAELSEMKAQVNQLSQELFNVKELCVTLSEKISQRSKKLSSLQHSLKKRTLNLNSYRQSILMISSQIAEQEKKVKESAVDEKKVSELEEKIKAKNTIYKKSQEETSAVEKKVAKLQDDILKLSKGKFSKAEENVNRLKKNLAEITQAITKSTVNMRQSKAKIAKLEAKIETNRAELATNEAQLISLKEKRDLITERGQKAKELKEQHEGQASEFYGKQKELKKEIAAISEKEQKLKSSQIEHKDFLKKCEETEGEKRGQIKSITTQIANQKLEQVEDDPTEIPTLSEEEIEQLNYKNLKTDFEIMRVQLEDNKPDISVIKKFEEKNEKYKEKFAELQELRQTRILHEKRKLELYKKRLSEFMKAFMVIRHKVKEIYMMLTAEGGDAALDLVNDHDPFAGGIIYSVRPPKKAWKNMCHLSGGEKTLSSLALVFSLHYYRTTPFYVMDEIDAALDERNVGIIGKYIMENQKNAQFIIVSLRSTMNELPEQLLGVFKVNNGTRQLSLCNVSKWAKKKKEDLRTQVETEQEPLEEEQLQEDETLEEQQQEEEVQEQQPAEEEQQSVEGGEQQSVEEEQQSVEEEQQQEEVEEEPPSTSVGRPKRKSNAREEVEEEPLSTPEAPPRKKANARRSRGRPSTSAASSSKEG